jgi:excisionase family DNA binding protein
VTDLARALIAQLEPTDLALLAERLGPYLSPPAESRGVIAYSPATLAAELGRSERSVRAAISRGELQAVKRGRGWVISAEAVAEWSRAPGVQFHNPGYESAPPRRASRPGPARRALHRPANTER